MKWNRWTLWTAALLILVGMLSAQSAGGFGGYGVGAAFPAMDALKTRLQAHGLNLQTPMVIHGGQGYGFGGNLILGGFGFGGAIQAENDREVVELSGGGGGFEIGRIWRTGPFHLALTAVIGGFGYELKFRPRLEDVDFDSLVANPRRVASLGTSSPLLGTSGMVVFPVISFFSLGLKAGVFYLPMVGDWKLADGAEVFNAPQIDPLAYSLQVIFLFGGWKEIPKKG